MHKQLGFTMIELVVVMVLLGILAAVAVPKFVDLSGQAEQSAADGVAGALGSASSVNYGACKAGSTSCVHITKCDDTGPLLQGGLPSAYSLDTTAVAKDATVSCTVTKGTTTSHFSAVGT